MIKKLFSSFGENMQQVLLFPKLHYTIHMNPTKVSIICQALKYTSKLSTKNQWLNEDDSTGTALAKQAQGAAHRSQNPFKKPGIRAHSRNPRAEEEETNRSLELIVQLN